MKPHLLKLCVRSRRLRVSAVTAAGKPRAWLRLPLRWRRRVPLATRAWKTPPLQHTCNSYVTHIHARREVSARGATSIAAWTRYRIITPPPRRAAPAVAFVHRPALATAQKMHAAAEGSVREPQRYPAHELPPRRVAETALVQRPVPRTAVSAPRVQATRSVHERVAIRSMQARTSLTAIDHRFVRRTTELRYARHRAADGGRTAVAASAPFMLARPHARGREPTAHIARRTPLPAAGSAQLVWRKPAVAPADTYTGTTPERVAQPAREAVSSAPLPRTAVPGVPAPAKAAEPLRATALDPALADRLAEDVVRRVEKRLRIERERRGL